MNARSASQGLGPCVCGAQSSAPVQVSEERIKQESLTFSLVSNKGKNAVDEYENAFFFTIFHFLNNSPEMRKQTFRVLLRSPRPPSAAAVSHCRVSALAAWRTSRCWRPS